MPGARLEAKRRSTDFPCARAFTRWRQKRIRVLDMWSGAVPAEMAAVFGSLARLPIPSSSRTATTGSSSGTRAPSGSSGSRPTKSSGSRAPRVSRAATPSGTATARRTARSPAMAARGESVNHFGLRLKGRDGDVVTVDVTILNLGARAPGDFFLAHILRTERIELPSLQDSEPPGSAAVAVRELAGVAGRPRAQALRARGRGARDARGRPLDPRDRASPSTSRTSRPGTTSRTSCTSSKSTPRARPSPSRSRSG